MNSKTRGQGEFRCALLGPKHGGVQLHLDPANPLAFGKRPKDVSTLEQEGEFELLRQLHRMSSEEFPNDAELQARINSYELAFRMQASVPETLDLTQETQETLNLYGIDNPTTAVHGQRCLAARRLAERACDIRWFT